MKKAILALSLLAMCTSLSAMDEGGLPQPNAERISLSEASPQDLRSFVAQKALKTIQYHHDALETFELLMNVGYPELASQAAELAIEKSSSRDYTMGVPALSNNIEALETLDMLMKYGCAELLHRAAVKAIEIMDDSNIDARKTLERLHRYCMWEPKDD